MKILLLFALLTLCVADLDSLREFAKPFLVKVGVVQPVNGLLECLTDATVEAWEKIYEDLEKIKWRTNDELLVDAISVDSSGAFEIFSEVINCSKDPIEIIEIAKKINELLIDLEKLKDKLEESKERVRKLLNSQISANEENDMNEAGESFGELIKELF